MLEQFSTQDHVPVPATAYFQPPWVLENLVLFLYRVTNFAKEQLGQYYLTSI